MSPRRTQRCPACGRRIRANHPYVALVNVQSGARTLIAWEAVCVVELIND